MYIFSEFFFCILYSGISSPKVIGTKFYCIGDSKILLHLLGIGWFTKQGPKELLLTLLQSSKLKYFLYFVLIFSRYD